MADQLPEYFRADVLERALQQEQLRRSSFTRQMLMRSDPDAPMPRIRIRLKNVTVVRAGRLRRAWWAVQRLYRRVFRISCFVEAPRDDR